MKNHRERRSKRIEAQSSPYPLPLRPSEQPNAESTTGDGKDEVFHLSETLINYNKNQIKIELNNLASQYTSMSMNDDDQDILISKCLEELKEITKTETSHSTNTKINNASYAKISKNFLKSLQNLNEERYQCFIKTSDDQPINIRRYLSEYEESVQRNQAIFRNITNHHNKILNEDWSNVVENNSALQSYAGAANEMGNKVWVTESNNLAFNYCKDYFISPEELSTSSHMDSKKLAIKYYMKELSSKNQARSDDRSYWDNLYNQLSQLPLIEYPAQRIKLLDVGSCYNPILKFPELLPYFDITAIDLCPADSSVAKCDFITVNIPSSYTEYEQLQRNSPKRDAELHSLPPSFYHAVVMSLVLCYLPTPAARERMIENARKVLISPGFEDKPHHGGLLIIIEKESILLSQNSGKVSVNRVTIDDWKSTICSKGFFLQRYELHVSSDRRKSHIFIFKATNLVAVPGESAEVRPLFIKQDFDRDSNVK
eukprot:gene3240-3453_t